MAEKAEKTKRYLVTGGAGFIGSNFIAYMLSRRDRIEVVNLDALTYCGNLANLRQVEDDERYTFSRGDIRDEGVLRELFREHGFDYVVNFAAESHVDRSITDPGAFVKTNVLGTSNLLAAAKESWDDGAGGFREGVRFLQVSTDEVYGSLGADGFFTEQTPLDPHSPYAASKAAADLLAKAYFDTYGLPVNITRCSNNYGRFQFPEKLIPLMINNCLAHKPLPVYGDGMQIRDWLYVDDHCKAIDMVLEAGKPGEVYNIGGHNERANIQIVKTVIGYIRERADQQVDERLIKHVEDRKGHDRRYGIDPEKIRRDLGWRPQTPFEEGIKRTIDWYLSNRDWMRDIVSGDYERYYEEQYGGRL
uniref:dTDP-glucose 4,6-dehydratase n=1 Tax=uncultured bacterium contig00006 TaxID=1181498 RepID=A0A806JYF8_9BACT|nr:dTDP-glucose 4,6-dehydratase [uncultured bacterium contig00006]